MSSDVRIQNDSRNEHILEVIIFKLIRIVLINIYTGGPIFGAGM